MKGKFLTYSPKIKIHCYTIYTPLQHPSILYHILNMFTEGWSLSKCHWVKPGFKQTSLYAHIHNYRPFNLRVHSHQATRTKLESQSPDCLTEHSIECLSMGHFVDPGMVVRGVLQHGTVILTLAQAHAYMKCKCVWKCKIPDTGCITHIQLTSHVAQFSNIT